VSQAGCFVASDFTREEAAPSVARTAEAVDPSGAAGRMPVLLFRPENKKAWLTSHAVGLEK
jgi:hypothetical protein